MIVLKNVKRLSTDTLSLLLKDNKALKAHGWLKGYVEIHGLKTVKAVIQDELRHRIAVDVVYTTRTDNEKEINSSLSVAKQAIFAGGVIGFLSSKFGKDIGLSDVTRLLKAAYVGRTKKDQCIKDDSIRRAIYVLQQVENFEAAELLADRATEIQRLKATPKLGSFSKQGLDVSLVSAGVVVAPIRDVTVHLASGHVITPRMLSKMLVSSQYFAESMYDKVMTSVLVLDHDLKLLQFKGHYLIKLAMLRKAKVTLDSINDGQVLVLQLVGNTLRPVAFPAIKLAKQAKLGFMEPGKSMVGFVNPKELSYPGLAERQEDGIVYLSTESAKKFAARQEKLNKDRPVFTTKLKMWFLRDVPEHLNTWFNTGCFYAARSWIEAYGACRVVSHVGNGLIKGASHLASCIDPVFDQEDVGVIACSSYKGGLNGLLRASGVVGVQLTEDGIDVPDGFWDTLVLSDGTELDAKLCEVEVLITNPYAVERYYESAEDEFETAGEHDLYTMEKVLNRNSFKYRSLTMAMDILGVCASGSNLLAEVTSRASEGLALKGNLTTVTSSEFETIRNSYGRDITLEYMRSLARNEWNSAVTTIAKKGRGTSILTGQYNVVREFTLETVLDVLKACATLHDVVLGVGDGDDYTFANRNFLLQFVDAIGANYDVDDTWICISHGLDKMYIPTGVHLYGGLLKSKPTVDKLTVEGCIGKLLSVLDKATAFGLTDNVAARCLARMQLEVQWKFLSKNFGKMIVKGNYFVLLPAPWLEHKYQVCMPARDEYVPESAAMECVRATIAKHPTLLMQSISSCDVFKTIPGIVMTPELYVALAPVLFVHPDYLLELQNDADGDQARVSFDAATLPYYGSIEHGFTVMTSPAVKFHEAYIAKEKKLVVHDHQSICKWTSIDLHDAIEQAAISKTRVGIYTDLMHKMAANIDLACPQVNELQRRHVIMVFSILIQECAMNAIKHNSSSSDLTVADTLSAKCMNEIQEVRGKKVFIGLKRAVDAVTKFLDAGDYEFDDNHMFAKVLVACARAIHRYTKDTNSDLSRKVFKDAPKAGVKFLSLSNAYATPGAFETNEGSSMFSHLLELFAVQAGVIKEGM
jgi:hypothetical protein